MNTPDMVQAAEALAFEAAALETRYSAVMQAYDDLDTVTPETLEPYNEYLKEYHAYSKKNTVFVMEFMTTFQARLAEVNHSLAEINHAQARTDDKLAEIDRNNSVIRGIRAANEAQDIILRADPDASCPTCGHGYGKGEEEDTAP